jgi:hypothetical protein
MVASLILMWDGDALASPVTSPNSGWYLTTSGAYGAALDSTTTTTTAQVYTVSLPAVPSHGSPYDWLVIVGYCDGARVDAQSGYVRGGSAGAGAGTLNLADSTTGWCPDDHTMTFEYGTQTSATSPSGASTAISSLEGVFHVRHGGPPNENYTVGATNPDDGTSDCGLNPFCYIKAALKWAFVPPADVTDGLGSAVSTLQTKFPFSILSAAVDVTTSLEVGHSACYGSTTTPFPHGCWPSWGFGGVSVFAYDSPAAVWLRASDHRAMLGAFLMAAVLVPLALGVFWQVIPVVGGGGGGD